MGKINQVQDMPVYQLVYRLALDVEKASRSFGPDFRWLRNQCLRSSESVCANLTEGFYTQYSTEYLQALYRCRREARETMMHITYAVDVGQVSETNSSALISGYEQSLMQLAGLTASIERKIVEYGKRKPDTNKLKEASMEYCIEIESSHSELSIDH